MILACLSKGVQMVPMDWPASDKAHCRVIAARRDGDEFVLLLPKISPQEAEGIAQRVKKRFPHSKSARSKGHFPGASLWFPVRKNKTFLYGISSPMRALKPYEYSYNNAFCIYVFR